MKRNSMRAYCESVLTRISFPRPFDIDTFCNLVAEYRQRCLYIHPLAGFDGIENAPCGIWVATDKADHIFVEPRTSEFHRQHIILHEIGHMLCDHQVFGESDALPLLFRGADFDPGYVRQLFMRTNYTSHQEKQAETVATLVMERVTSQKNRLLEAEDRTLGYALGFGEMITE